MVNRLGRLLLESRKEFTRPSNEPIKELPLNIYEEGIIVYYAEKHKSPTKGRRQFYQEFYEQEFSRFECYNDWIRCPVTIPKIKRWTYNVKNFGRTRKERPRKYKTDPAKWEALIKRAKEVIERVKGNHSKKIASFLLSVGIAPWKINILTFFKLRFRGINCILRNSYDHLLDFW